MSTEQPDYRCPPGTCPDCDLQREVEQRLKSNPELMTRFLEIVGLIPRGSSSATPEPPTPEPNVFTINIGVDPARPEQESKSNTKTSQEQTMSKKNDDIETQISKLSIERSGTKLLVPEELPLEVAVEALTRKIRDEEKMVTFSQRIDVCCSEGAVAFLRVLEREFSFVSAVSKGWFQDPFFMGIDVGHGEQVQVPWCPVMVPGIEGTLTPEFVVLKDQVVFQISGNVKGKHRSKAERVVQLVREECDRASIYRGKAISVSFDAIKDLNSLQDTFPRFPQLNAVQPEDVIFSRELADQVDVSLYTPIRRTAECRKHGIPLKRGVLLEGPFGVGKTMTAAATATLCKENGWTYIYLKKASQLAQAYAFAQRYQPAVIFTEDIDQTLKGASERDEKVNNILNALDGIDSKGVEIITVLTTNNIDEITRALLRPGRLDTVVSVKAPDAQAATLMVRKFAGNLLDPTSDLTECGQVLDGAIPALIREVVERSKLAAMRRPGPLTLRAEDVTVTARSMLNHMGLLKEPEEDYRSELEKAADITGQAILEAARISRKSPNGSATSASMSVLSNGAAADAE